MNSNVASSGDNGTIFNSLIIPNEHKSVTNNHSAVIHKGKKFNYVCDINPQKIHSISGKVTDLSGAPIFHGIHAANTFTYALTGITSGKIDRLIESGETFGDINGIGITGAFLATHLTTATTLHFSTNRLITTGLPSEANDEKATVFSNNAGDITFTGTGSGVNIVITNSGGATVNPNLHLVNEPGRFIAEFSIVSRE